MKDLRAWFAKSTVRKILGASALITVATVLVKAASLVKDMAVARAFGTSHELETFLVAFALCMFLVSVLAGSFFTAFVPLWIRIQAQRGAADAAASLAAASGFALVLLAGATLLTVALAPSIFLAVAPGFGPAARAQSVELYRQLAVIVLISGMASFYGSVLNSRTKFGVPALVGVFTPLATLVVLLAVMREPDVGYLVAATVAGALLELGVVLVAAQRHGCLVLPTLARREPLAPLLRHYLPVVVGAFVIGSTTLVEQAFASTLAQGGLAALNFAVKLPALVTGLLAVAVGTAVLPYFARAVAAGELLRMDRALVRYSWVIFAAGAAVVGAAVVVAEPLVRAMFKGGAFTEADVGTVATIAKVALLQVPFFALGLMYSRLLSALGHNKTLLLGNIVSLAVCVALNTLLVPRFGALGIALTTGAMYAVAVVFLFVSVRLVVRRARSADGAAGA
jgi:putative peptidoglycan lipid II flippase